MLLPPSGIDHPPAFLPTPFRCHPWLKHRHAQTIYCNLFARRAADVAWQEAGRERLFTMPDGDRLRAVWHPHPTDPGRTRPLVVLLHGLEGSEDSHYVRGLSSKAYALGYHSLRLNYRGCGPHAALARRLYNGHLIADVDAVLREVAAEAPGPVFPIGVSLGANKLLRLLATYGDHPLASICGAVAISPPIDFHQTSASFRRGLNVVYDRFFLRLLKAKMRVRVARADLTETELAIARQALGARTLREYDEVFTAPSGGFADAHAYYEATGSGDGLGAIRVPTLILHATDDPLIPMAMFDERATLIRDNPLLTMVFTAGGGHVGFLEPTVAPPAEPWMDAFWAENTALHYVRWLFEHTSQPG